MIEDVVARWHECLAGNLAGGWDSLLHDDVVFYSPIVFTPQRGKEVTKLYLAAAGSTLGGQGGGATTAERPFRYVTEIMQSNRALLEFESEMNGKYVNGVDLITCDDNGLVTEIKVMIRPLQAVNEIHAQMKARLEELSGQ